MGYKSINSMSKSRNSTNRSKSRSQSQTRGKSTTKVKIQLKPKGNLYLDLASIVEKPEKQLSCFGIVLDATGAYKTYDSTDYVTKLKIVDSSFNFENKVPLKRYIHVFIYSATPEEAPRITRLGSVIKLKGFDVTVIFKKSLANMAPKKLKQSLTKTDQASPSSMAGPTRLTARCIKAETILAISPTPRRN